MQIILQLRSNWLTPETYLVIDLHVLKVCIPWDPRTPVDGTVDQQKLTYPAQLCPHCTPNNCLMTVVYSQKSRDTCSCVTCLVFKKGVFRKSVTWEIWLVAKRNQHLRTLILKRDNKIRPWGKQIGTKSEINFPVLAQVRFCVVV